MSMWLHTKACDQADNDYQHTANTRAKLEFVVIRVIPHFRPYGVDYKEQAVDDPRNVRKNTLFCNGCQNKAENQYADAQTHLCFKC